MNTEKIIFLVGVSYMVGGFMYWIFQEQTSPIFKVACVLPLAAFQLLAVKTPSPQEADKTLAEEIENLFVCADDYANDAMRDSTLKERIKNALLEADKNGYERGRREIIEDVSDVLTDDKHANVFAMLQATIRYIEKARLAPSVGLSDGKP